MMFVLNTLSFFTFIIYLFLGAYAILQNPKNIANRTFLFISFIFSFWSFSAFVRNILYTYEVIMLWKIASLLSWTFGSAAILFFVISLINQKQSQESSNLLSLIYVPAIFFFLVEMSFFFSYSNDRLVQIIDQIVAPIFYMLHLIISLILLFRWYRRCESGRERKQSIIILLTLTATTIAIFLYSEIAPIFFGNDLPFLLPVFPIFWISGMWISLTKFRLLEFKPHLAVQEVLANIIDGIVMFDHKGRIIEANDNFQILLNLDFKNIKGKTIYDLFGSNPGLVDDFYSCLSGKGDSVQEEVSLLGKGKDSSRFLRLIATPVVASNLEIVGLVVTVHDLTNERKNTVYAMAVTANHEINQPLTIIKANLQMIEHNLNDPEKIISEKEMKHHLKRALDGLGKIDVILTKYRDTKQFTLKNYTKDVKMIHFEEQ